MIALFYIDGFDERGRNKADNLQYRMKLKHILG